MDNLAKQLAFSIQQAKVPEEEARAYFGADPTNDARWGETLLFDDSPTGQPRILINHQKHQEAGSGPDYAREMEFGEGLHFLKYIDPVLFNDLYITAMSEEEPRRWLEESYQYAVNDGEKRSFEDFVRHSRLDQVIGGYFSGGEDSNIGTMHGWHKGLPYGQEFRSKLEGLGSLLGITNGVNPWFKKVERR